MSYASVAAHNAPPPSEQPHPDPALLTTAADVESTTPADDGAKVNVVPSDFKEHPSTLTSEVAESILDYTPPGTHASSEKPLAHKRDDVERNVEAKGFQLWDTVHKQLMRPAFAGGLFGVGLYACFSATLPMPTDSSDFPSQYRTASRDSLRLL